MKDILVICALWVLPAYLVLRLNAWGILWGCIVMWLSYVLTCMVALQSELRPSAGLHGAITMGWIVGLAYCSIIFCGKRLALRIRRKNPNRSLAPRIADAQGTQANAGAKIKMIRISMIAVFLALSVALCWGALWWAVKPACCICGVGILESSSDTFPPGIAKRQAESHFGPIILQKLHFSKDEGYPNPEYADNPEYEERMYQAWKQRETIYRFAAIVVVLWTILSSVIVRGIWMSSRLSSRRRLTQ